MSHRIGEAMWFACSAAAVIFSGCSPSGSVATKPEQDRAIAVRTVAVETTEIQRATTQPASVHAYYQAEIRPKVSGYVSDVIADIGDVVQAGETLAKVDVPEMEKRREIAEAKVARLESEERRAVAGVTLADAEVLSSEANLAQTESELQRVDASLAAAESEFNRTKDLVDRGSLENRKLDEVRKKRDSELAAKQSVSSAIESAKAQVSVANAKRGAAAADLDAAKADTVIARRELEEIQVMIDYATIRAPFDGVISRRSVEPGSLVGGSLESAGTKPMYVISQTQKLRVRVPIPEIDAARINPGDEVTLEFPSFSDEPAITAAVTRRTGTLDPNTRTMTVEIEVDNPNGKLMPGMFGQATIRSAAKVATQTLPARAVRFSEDGKAYVYAIDSDDTVSVVSVDTGYDDGNRIEVVSGLQAGRHVIDAHLKRFTDGQKVAVLTD